MVSNSMTTQHTGNGACRLLHTLVSFTVQTVLKTFTVSSPYSYVARRPSYWREFTFYARKEPAAPRAKCKHVGGER